MSVIPRTQLSRSEMRMLGNNLDPRRPNRRRRRELAAVNRSIARTGEQITRLHRPWQAVA